MLRCSTRNRGETPVRDPVAMAQLAQFRLGRILLHLGAMLGDGAVRFHSAGIIRELPWMAG
jgi:hypothetical protein